MQFRHKWHKHYNLGLLKTHYTIYRAVSKILKIKYLLSYSTFWRVFTYPLSFLKFTVSVSVCYFLNLKAIFLPSAFIRLGNFSKYVLIKYYLCLEFYTQIVMFSFLSSTAFGLYILPYSFQAKEKYTHRNNCCGAIGLLLCDRPFNMACLWLGWVIHTRWAGQGLKLIIMIKIQRMQISLNLGLLFGFNYFPGIFYSSP